MSKEQIFGSDVSKTWAELGTSYSEMMKHVVEACYPEVLPEELEKASSLIQRAFVNEKIEGGYNPISPDIIMRLLSQVHDFKGDEPIIDELEITIDEFGRFKKTIEAMSAKQLLSWTLTEVVRLRLHTKFLESAIESTFSNPHMAQAVIQQIGEMFIGSEHLDALDKFFEEEKKEEEQRNANKAFTPEGGFET